MHNKNNLALITGATSGIGEACAQLLAEKNYNLILCGRRSDRLKSLADSLQKNNSIEIKILTFDISKQQGVEKAINSLTGKWLEIDFLINNAGLALGLQPIQAGDIADWESMIDTNVKGLLYVTRLISPLMIGRGKGHIINIGSVAGREVYLNGNVYCATKHAVDALSKAMRIDMLPHGIKVSQIAPGAVNTEFSLVRFKGDAEAAQNVYAGFEPLKSEDVARAVWFVMSLPPHVNVNDLLIMPMAQAAAGIIKRS